MYRWSPALAIASIAIVATLLTTLAMALAVKLVQRVRRGLRGGGGGDGGSWRERLPFGKRSYAVCKVAVGVSSLTQYHHHLMVSMACLGATHVNTTETRTSGSDVAFGAPYSSVDGPLVPRSLSMRRRLTG